MGIAGAIGGALISAGASRSAAKGQEQSAKKDIAFQRETRDLIRSDLSPYRTGGYTAQQALDFELGLGARPMIGGTMPTIEEYSLRQNLPLGPDGRPLPAAAMFGGAGKGGVGFRVNGQEFKTRAEAEAYAKANLVGGTEYGGFTKTPGYDFRLQQGQDSLEAGAAARGGLYSGAAMRDLLKFGQDYGSNEYGNYLSRLGARADTGMSAAQASGQASQQAAAGVSNALGNIGNARAAGAIGVGNALVGGIQNVAGIWNYQRNLAPGASSAPMYGGGR